MNLPFGSDLSSEYPRKYPQVTNDYVNVLWYGQSQYSPWSCYAHTCNHIWWYLHPCHIWTSLCGCCIICRDREPRVRERCHAQRSGIMERWRGWGVEGEGVYSVHDPQDRGQYYLHILTPVNVCRHVSVTQQITCWHIEGVPTSVTIGSRLLIEGDFITPSETL